MLLLPPTILRSSHCSVLFCSVLLIAASIFGTIFALICDSSKTSNETAQWNCWKKLTLEVQRVNKYKLRGEKKQDNSGALKRGTLKSTWLAIAIASIVRAVSWLWWSLF